MDTFFVSIGRNVGATPATPVAWEQFQSDLLYVLTGEYLLDIVFQGTGFGVYEGVIEESFTVICTGVCTSVLEGQLSESLGRLARDYGQDSIALTIGETQFCSV